MTKKWVHNILTALGLYSGVDILLRTAWVSVKQVAKWIEHPLARAGDFDLIYSQWTSPTWTKTMAEYLLNPPIGIPSAIVLLVGAYFFMQKRRHGHALVDEATASLVTSNNGVQRPQSQIENSEIRDLSLHADMLAEMHHEWEQFVLRMRSAPNEAEFAVLKHEFDRVFNADLDTVENVLGFAARKFVESAGLQAVNPPLPYRESALDFFERRLERLIELRDQYTKKAIGTFTTSDSTKRFTVNEEHKIISKEIRDLAPSPPIPQFDPARANDNIDLNEYLKVECAASEGYHDGVKIWHVAVMVGFQRGKYRSIQRMSVSISNISNASGKDFGRRPTGLEDWFRKNGKIPLACGDKQYVNFYPRKKNPELSVAAFEFLTFEIGMNSYDLRISHILPEQFPASVWPTSLNEILFVILVEAPGAQEITQEFIVRFVEEQNGNYWDISSR